MGYVRTSRRRSPGRPRRGAHLSSTRSGRRAAAEVRPGERDPGSVAGLGRSDEPRSGAIRAERGRQESARISGQLRRAPERVLLEAGPAPT